jgi:TolB-like protein
MTEQHEANVDLPDAQPLTPEQAEKKRRKKREKVRSAWISFVGRILAQVIGATATITLGLMVVQRYQAPAADRVTPMADELAPARVVTPGGTSVAVLPLLNYSADTDESFANGMTEALIADLARQTPLRVVSRTSSMQFKQQGRSMPQIGRALGVDFIIEGSVVKANGRVRVTAQLIDARSDEHLWADWYDRPLRDVLSVHSEIATAIARAVSERIAADRQLAVATAANRR